MHHKTAAAPPGPKKDRKMRRKLSWGLAIFVTITNVIAHRGDEDRFILLSLAALCIIFCLSADRLDAKRKQA